ncbi:MAG: tetratricopeptide repeat protein [Alysiella sp.]|uniref:tetratricopeptide repeat protein n=1 Tax=Alysiella sp. TaxID=1872483 RepID=UPI0026DD011B|nr:tetratricopeptide repeat protein [Alysiella sp.]MDO4433704.1 tetratricopeptide repeat protein [Alysiella sp.]
MSAQQIQHHIAELIQATQLSVAKPLLQTLHHKTETQYGTQSDEHLQTLLLIACWHTAAGEYEAAKPLLQRLAEYPHLTDAKIALAKLYRECGAYPNAQTLLQELLPKLPENSIQYAQAQNEMGLVLLGLEHPNQALTQFEHAAALFQQLCGEHHLHTVRAFRNVATVYRIQRHHKEALSVLNSLLSISENLYPHSHPETAEILAEIAQLHDECGEHALSTPLYQRAIAILSQTLGEQHPLFARLLCRHAIHFMQQRLPEKALPLLHQAAVIYLNVFDETHPAVQNLLRFIVIMQLMSDGFFPDVDTVIQ